IAFDEGDAGFGRNEGVHVLHELVFGPAELGPVVDGHRADFVAVNGRTQGRAHPRTHFQIAGVIQRAYELIDEVAVLLSRHSIDAVDTPIGAEIVTAHRGTERGIYLGGERVPRRVA